MKFTIDMNAFIGIVSFVVALGSYIYTWHFNHFSVDLINKAVETIDNHRKISFSVINISTRPLLITNIELKKGQKIIHDNGFNVVRFEEAQLKAKAESWERENSVNILGNVMTPGLNPYRIPLAVNSYYSEESNNFEEPEYVLSTEKSRFSYFVDEIPDTVTITADVRISFFSHSKSFVVHFDQQ